MVPTGSRSREWTLAGYTMRRKRKPRAPTMGNEGPRGSRCKATPTTAPSPHARRYSGMADRIRNMPTPVQPCPYCGYRIAKFEFVSGRGFGPGTCAQCGKVLPTVIHGDARRGGG